MGQKVETYTDTIIGDDQLHLKKSKLGLYKDGHMLSYEDGNHDFVEMDMKKSKVDDDKPLIMAKTIVQSSKLHFLKFVYEVLWKYLTPGSFKLNYCDTDSLCICKLVNSTIIQINNPLESAKITNIFSIYSNGCSSI